MIFAAKYAAERDLEKKVAKRVEKVLAEQLEQMVAEVREKAREQERRRVMQVLEEHGIRLPPEVAQRIAGGSGPRC